MAMYIKDKYFVLINLKLDPRALLISGTEESLNREIEIWEGERERERERRGGGRGRKRELNRQLDRKSEGREKHV